MFPPRRRLLERLGETRDSATMPHAFATVVLQCPRFCRDSAPRTRRPTSSRQSGSSSTASSARFALTSADDHQPPQRVGALGRERHDRALEVEPRRAAGRALP